MKNIVLLILLSIITPFSYTMAFFNEPDGFREFKWGQELHDILISSKDKFSLRVGFAENLKYPKGAELYIKENEDLTIGGCKFAQINYCFLNNKFYGIYAIGFERDNYDTLLKSASVKFGHSTSTENNKYFSQKIWSGEETKITLAFLNEENSFDLHIESLKILEQNRIEAKIKPSIEGW